MSLLFHVRLCILYLRFFKSVLQLHGFQEKLHLSRQLPFRWLVILTSLDEDILPNTVDFLPCFHILQEVCKYRSVVGSQNSEIVENLNFDPNYHELYSLLKVQLIWNYSRRKSELHTMICNLFNFFLDLVHRNFWIISISLERFSWKFRILEGSWGEMKQKWLKAADFEIWKTVKCVLCTPSKDVSKYELKTSSSSSLACQLSTMLSTFL